jgi:diguanylate cyclase (GGDEF)-like protein
MNETLTAAERRSDGPESSLAREWMLIAMSGDNVGKIYTISKQKPLIILGRGDNVDVQILDGEISRRHAAIRYDAKSDTFLIADLNSRNGTHVNGKSCESEQSITVGDKIRLGNHAVLRVSNGAETEAAYAKQMYQAVLRDGLTQAFNRRYLDERLESELAFGKRHGEPVSLLLLDIDHFKRVNDTHGHQAGDAVLVHFCGIVQAQVRTEDVVARYGGEEFAVVCRQIDEERAAILGERLRVAIERAPLVLPDKQIPVTVSIGIACAPRPGVETVAQLVERTDEALYEAKRQGRNRVVLSSHLARKQPE